MAVDEVIVKFKRKVFFRRYIQKKKTKKNQRDLAHEFINFVTDVLTYDMKVYLGKQRNMTSTDVTPTYGRVLELFREVEGAGHKILI
jgi:hypothetical protein